MTAPALPASHRIEVDWTRPGPLSDAEIERIRQWYGEHHGEGNLDRARFIAFWLDHDSAVVKSYRRWVQTALAGVPNTVAALTVLHTYTVLGWDSGAQYELIAALKYGATRAQALEALAYAFIHAGPMGMGRVAPLCDEYLKKWDGSASQAASWPDGWAPDPAAFRSGIDLASPGMTADEIDRVFHWYNANQGEVPSHIRFLARWNPGSLKSMRNRFESCIVTLPKQIVPLMTFNTAAILREPAAMRRAAHQARLYGVKRSHMLPMLQVAMVYTGDMGSEAIADVLAPMFDNWPD
jgi:hypothetical protein